MKQLFYLFSRCLRELAKANEDWICYVERMTLCFAANRIEELKKKDYFANKCQTTDIQANEKFISTKQTG